MAAAGELGLEDVSRIYQVLADLERGLKTSAQPRFLFEAALVRISSLGAVRSIEQVLADLGGGEVPPAPAGPGGPNSTGGGTGERRQPRGATSNPTAGPDRRKTPPRGAARSAGTEKSATPAPKPASDPSDPRSAFEQAVGSARPLLGGILPHAEIRVEDDLLRVEFPAGSEALRRQAERPECRETLAECAREIWGRTLEIRTGIARAPAKAAVAQGRNEQSGADGPGSPRGNRSSDLLRAARGEPGVKCLLHEFGAQILDIRPLEEPRPEAGDDDSTDLSEDAP